MRYLTEKMEDAHLERQWRGEIKELRAQLESRIEVLERPSNPAFTTGASPNYLPNSHPEWSHKAYTTLGIERDDTTDDNLRAYNWQYRESTDFQTTTASPQYLLAEGHSSFTGLPAGAPVWERVPGTILLGAEDDAAGLYDAVAPLPTDFVFPGQRYYVSFEARTEFVGQDVPNYNEEEAQLFVGFFDGDQEQWITGSAFTPTAQVFGVQGTRTFKYKVLATTDVGYQLLSNEITVTGVPSALDANNHVRLFFSGAPGFVQFEIFRYEAAIATYRKVADIRNSIDLQFYDVQENAGVIVDGYPTITENAPQAFNRTADLPPVDQDAFTPYTFIIQIPTTYDRTTTPNGNQWFRVGLTKPIGVNQGIAIRRFMVSEGYGAWTRAALDMGAKSAPSLLAQSDVGTSVIIEGPVPNGPTCVDLDTLIDIWVDGHIEQIPMRDVEVGMNVVSGWQALPVKAVKQGTVQQVIEFVTEGDKRLICSESHRLITSIHDRKGVAASNLSRDDYVLVDWDGIPRLERIVSRTVHFGSFVVKSITLPAPHLYTTNGFISHNNKVLQLNPYAAEYFNTAFQLEL